VAAAPGCPEALRWTRKVGAATWAGKERALMVRRARNWHAVRALEHADKRRRWFLNAGRLHWCTKG